jgi:uncharacterized protein (TIGR00645 family)
VTPQDSSDLRKSISDKVLPMMKRILQKCVFQIRWLLLPFMLMMVIGLIGLMFKAARSTVHFIYSIYSVKDDFVKVELLELIDLTLIAALVIIVTIAVYGNFVSRIDPDATDDGPSWMATVDFTELKLKVLTTLVAISAIRLLEVFMEAPQIDDRDIYVYIALHLTFVVSRLSMAIAPRPTSNH